ncbi:hypothetical protein L208DRAFT_1390132 [Tricholoma matsutake]|nr:hypothetical protein L208DRAFT_1390132 [Tricholoma matsutake 945]
MFYRGRRTYLSRGNGLRVPQANWRPHRYQIPVLILGLTARCCSCHGYEPLVPINPSLTLATSNKPQTHVPQIFITSSPFPTSPRKILLRGCFRNSVFEVNGDVHEACPLNHSFGEDSASAYEKLGLSCLLHRF